MRTFVLVIAALFSVFGAAQAVEITHDNFDYPDGSLVGNGAWVNHSGTEGDLMVASGQAVVQHGAPSEDANVPFAPSGTDDIFFGIDFTVDDPGAPIPGTDNEYFAHFKDDTTFNFCGRLDIVPAPSGGDFSVGIASDSSTADAVWPNDLTYGVTYRAVVRYSQVNNQAELWIDASAVSDPSLLGADQPDPGDVVQGFALRQSDSNLNETIRIDALVVGTTFDDVVVPVPVELQSFSIE